MRVRRIAFEAMSYSEQTYIFGLIEVAECVEHAQVCEIRSTRMEIAMTEQAKGAAYYRALADEAEQCGTCTRCDKFSLEYLRDDVCPTCEAYAAEHGPPDSYWEANSGPYEPMNYREDMRNAGRGHLI
jgi:hypothetical protein